jgi:hypothetical protein
MHDAKAIAENYIALWNETDPPKRARLLAERWSSDATYVDPLTSGAGHEEIDGVIAAVQSRFPAFRFAIIGNADGFRDRLRFSWSFGPPDGEAVVKGTDYVLCEGDRIKAVSGFIDHALAAA